MPVLIYQQKQGYLSLVDRNISNGSLIHPPEAKMNVVNYLLVTVFALLFAASSAKVVDSISTRATRAEGILVCGKQPIVGAYVRLFKANSDELTDIIATTTTDSSGRFTIEGDTHSKEGLEAQIDPFLKFYHKCGDEEGKKKYLGHGQFITWTIHHPRQFITCDNSSPATIHHLDSSSPATIHHP
ncbi:transthyretin-like family domain-containing protein [Ditylenchus destructor]|uniref:Transthyretin-like family domain-containing protein n=1 Tax=Ditylenchus destructor TaxID=166010 RepID=A0AAD4N8S1_9BILA|nr:transthyretin-like family domain-containing protein [Ditylenchus destructor]